MRPTGGGFALPQESQALYISTNSICASFHKLMQLKRIDIMATEAAYSNPDFNKTSCTKVVLQDQWPYVVIHVGIFAVFVERSEQTKKNKCMFWCAFVGQFFVRMK